MAAEIRGLTVKFDADFSEFKKGMKDANTDIKSTEKQLKSLESSLKLEWDETKFSQAQTLARNALEATEQKAQLLRDRLAEIQEKGVTDKNRKEYNYLQEELAKTETNAASLKQKLEQINNLKLDQAIKQIDKVSQGLTSAGQAFAPFSAAAAAAIAGAYKLGTTAATTGAELDDLSQRLGVSAEKIQEWQYLAVQTGVDVEIFNKALIRARAAMLDLSSGTINNSAESIQALGLDMSQFGSQEEMFDGILKALAGMENKTLQAAYANEIFGDKIANQMLPFLNAGAAEIEKFTNEFKQFDSLSNEQVKALAGLDDTIFRLKESIRYAALQLGTAFMPLLKELATTIQEKVTPIISNLAEWIGNMSTEQQKTILGILTVVTAISPLLLLLGKVASGVSNIIKLVKLLGPALSSSLGWVGLILALVALLIAKSENLRNALKNLVDTLIKSLQPAFRIIQKLLSYINPLIELLGDMIANSLTVSLKMLEPVLIVIGKLFEAIYNVLEPLWWLLDKIIQGVEWVVSLFGGEKIGVSEEKAQAAVGNTDWASSEYSSGASSSVSNINSSEYNDYSSVTINIEKNDYMSEDDIIKAVNRGLKQAKQERA